MNRLFIIAKKRGIILASLALATMFTLPNTAQAVPFTILTNDIITSQTNTSSRADSYTGPGGESGITRSDFRGTAADGGYDAYDVMGSLSNLGSLTAQRRTETLSSLNMQRWFDTITNPTQSTISTTVYWWGNLGSDGYQSMVGQNDFSAVNVDDLGFDPSIAFVWGNNDFARDQMSFNFYDAPDSYGISRDWVHVAIDLTLEANESTSLLFYTFLARDLNDRSADTQLALDTAAGLVQDPFLTGLSSSEIAGIRNFGSVSVPEPGSIAMLGLGLAGVFLSRKRKHVN